MSKISKNIRHLRKMKGLSQEQFADELKISRSRVGSYEENRSEPPISLLVEISKYFQVPIDILIKNDLSKSKGSSFIDIGKQRVLFPISVDENNEDLIEIVSVQASAGYLEGYADPEYIESLEKIKLPFLDDQKHRAFPIKGDSMLPLKDGSIVVAKFVEDHKQIRKGKTYILVTLNDGIVYKRITKQSKKSLLLSSDNTLYQPYEIPTTEVLEVWEFSCSIQREEYDADELKISKVETLLKEVQDLIHS